MFSKLYMRKIISNMADETSEDNIVEDLIVSIELSSSNFKIVCFILKIPDINTGGFWIFKLNFQKIGFYTLHSAFRKFNGAIDNHGRVQ